MWEIVKSYIWWTHPRGSLRYDVMVTLILAFIFIGPRYIDFRDKPTAIPGRADNQHYVVSANSVHFLDDEGARRAFAQQLEPQAGRVRIEKWEPLRDGQGNIAAYEVFVKSSN